MPARRDLFLILAFLIISCTSVFSQIVFKEPSDYEKTGARFNFIENSSVRRTIVLNGGWSVYSYEDENKEKTRVRVPSVFEGEGDLVFEKAFEIPSDYYRNNNFELNFLGISYIADISINNKLIFKHSGGEFPFSLPLPKDLLRKDKKNILSVRVNSKLDPQGTIPVKQRFLFPKSYGGIFRDVFIRVVPNVNLNNISYSYDIANNYSNVKLKVFARISNNQFVQRVDSGSSADNIYEIRASISSDTSGGEAAATSQTLEVKRGKERSTNLTLSANNIRLWTPERPMIYKLRIQLLKNGGVIDDVVKRVSFYSLKPDKESLNLNGSKFKIEGVTYVPGSGGFTRLMSYEEMEEDVKIMKETGFNFVKFTRRNPHPYLLSLCERYGLLVFAEIPLNSIPESLGEDYLFLDRSKVYLSRFLKSYNNYTIIAGVGLGTGYLGKSEEHIYYLNNLYKEGRGVFNKIIYASFINYQIEENSLDMLGVEMLNVPIKEISGYYGALQEQYGTGRVFISEAGYTANAGPSSGYTNPHTNEAQAKFFDELISYSEDEENAGYFCHTMFDYYGDYRSLVSGYNEDGLVRLGILGVDRNTNRLSHKLISSKLHNSEKVTIPLGIKKDDSPMIFIIFGLGLALFLGFLANSTRRFREDASRALIRPYNFFADIRDMRIISGLHTTLLAIIVAGVMGLITSSILFSLRDNILLEKMLVATGSNDLINLVSYLAWNPIESTLYLTIFSFLFEVLIGVLIKISSLFVINKVYLSNSYYTGVWSFLPMVLIIPLAIVLYRLIAADILVVYLYAILIIFGLIVIYRILKGMHVIYDVIAGRVYLASFLFVLLVLVVLYVVMQYSNSGADYLIHTIREFRNIEI